MDRRKVQIVGGSTFSVTLPKRWATHHQLKAGDEVFIERTSDQKLIIRTEPDHRTESKSIETTLDGNELSFPNQIITLYYSGFELIAITSSKEIKPHVRKRIRRIVHSLSGTQITLESERRIEISVIINQKRVDVRQVIYRMSLLIKESIGSLKEGDKESATHNEQEIDRLYHLARRTISMTINDASLISSTGISDISTIPAYIMISKRLESISDRIEELSTGRYEPEFDLISKELTKATRHLLKSPMPVFGGLGLAKAPELKGAQTKTRIQFESAWRNLIEIHALVTEVSVIHTVVHTKSS